MTTILNYALYISLFIHIILIAIAAWRVWRGENVIDRLMGVELMGTLTLAVLILTAVIADSAILRRLQRLGGAA